MARRQLSIANSVPAGLLGGLAGTISMSKFQNAWNEAASGERSTFFSRPEEEPTDIVACTRIASRLTCFYRLSVSKTLLRICGLTMHYAFGAGAGLLYGFLREAVLDETASHSVAAVVGALLGTTMFFAADEIVTPMSGFKRGSLMGSRAFGVASHVVYGVALAAVYERTRRFSGATL
ncbi:MAG TPA: hypothetical protein VM715_14565 [Candidatus Acidoferrum sp.]|jgi:hypothetical protein|nr:hypothetical protein [Candidatus Acidoferrum sp.]